MFAFFVVMFAYSQTDKAKAKAVSDSVREALASGGVTATVREVLGGTVDEKGKGNAMMRGPGGAQKVSEESPTAAVELLPSLEYLSTALAHEIELGKIQLRLQPRGLVVSLQQASFFPSGEDTVDPATYPSLETIATVILDLPNGIRLEGHTDSVPIHTQRFKSNWELSAARAIAMLNLFNKRFGVDLHRMAIAGYADTVPIMTNDTAEGRARNRRVDLVIMSQHALADTAGPLMKAAAGETGATPQKKSH